MGKHSKKGKSNLRRGFDAALCSGAAAGALLAFGGGQASADPATPPSHVYILGHGGDMQREPINKESSDWAEMMRRDHSQMHDAGKTAKFNALAAQIPQGGDIYATAQAVTTLVTKNIQLARHDGYKTPFETAQDGSGDVQDVATLEDALLQKAKPGVQTMILGVNSGNREDVGANDTVLAINDTPDNHAMSNNPANPQSWLIASSAPVVVRADNNVIAQTINRPFGFAPKYGRDSHGNMWIFNPKIG